MQKKTMPKDVALPRGFLLSGTRCGIKKRGLDLGLIYCNDLSIGVGFFTKNANTSYSVGVSKKNIKNKVKAILVNSGNANCFSHKHGLKDTQRLCQELAKSLSVKKGNILIASTGIIGKKLPYKKIMKCFPELVNNLSSGQKSFSLSILSTDTFRKVAYRNLKINGKQVKIIGFAKGAGMISPNLATMLAFILTDAGFNRKTLKKISYDVLEDSFNSITVDGCMSTNDSVYILASSKSAFIQEEKDLENFRAALKEVCLGLAKMIVKDAEGATKFIQINILGACSKEEAERAARAVANSPLFKSSLYGENPNWGRIVAALGQAGIPVKENEFIVKSTPWAKDEIKMNVYLEKGFFSKTIYTSDLTPNYVKINASYS